MSAMSMMLIALVVVPLQPSQTGATQTVTTMQPDVDRLVRAAEKLAGTWPSQPPPPIPEVAIVARHGKAVVPLLMVLLSDDPNAERDRKRWKVQQQVALTLCRIYSESQHCGRTYCDGDPRERIARVRDGWLRVIAADKEMQALSTRELLDRFKGEKVFWRQFEIGKALATACDRGAIAELEAWLKHDDRHLRGNRRWCWEAPSCAQTSSCTVTAEASAVAGTRRGGTCCSTILSGRSVLAAGR